ncbi:hypothetical protein GCM10010129_07650 [Streptomyces fumigatiscleroticus]|nr:hypothetical protein GCM10010129_07650 [Streptomyces fumigatiscleroticus]
MIFAALLFEGWTTHEVDAARTRRPCTRPVPRAVGGSGPVLRRLTGEKVSSAAVVSSAAAPARTVALTYDGGPDPEWTPRLLDLLRKHHAHATFFVYGAQAARHPDLVRRILDEGHEIGSDTYTGADLGSSSRVRFAMELALTQKTLAGSAGIRTELLRMPLTSQVDTLCGAEWQAARNASADGYVLVAADQPARDPAHGLIRQCSQRTGVPGDEGAARRSARRPVHHRDGRGRHAARRHPGDDRRTVAGQGGELDGDRRAHVHARHDLGAGRGGLG